MMLTQEEMAILITLSQPIAPQDRAIFIAQAEAEIEARAGTGEAGAGLVHRIGRQVQARFTLAPQRFGH